MGEGLVPFSFHGKVTAFPSLAHTLNRWSVKVMGGRDWNPAVDPGPVPLDSADFLILISLRLSRTGLCSLRTQFTLGY